MQKKYFKTTIVSKVKLSIEKYTMFICKNKRPRLFKEEAFFELFVINKLLLFFSRSFC